MTTKVQMPAEANGKTGSSDASSSGVSPALALVAGWLVPGAGHLLLGKWVRALLLMVSIVGMFAIGIALAGKVYTPNTGEPLDMLGFAGDLGAGLLYLLARVLGWGQAPVLVAVADYGTKFIVVAGLLNIVAAVDAHSLASGRKQS
jgi:TM2 domain-containing membrane protein YozV